MNVTEPSEGGTRYACVKFITNPSNCPTNERRRVVLSFKSISVFVQTDKPVYRRDDDGTNCPVSCVSKRRTLFLVRIFVAVVKPDHTLLDDDTEVLFSK